MLLEQSVIFLPDALCLGRTEFVQQPHPLHVDQLEQQPEDLDLGRLSLLLFVTPPKISQACLFLNQTSDFRIWGHLNLVNEDYKTNLEELALKVPKFDVLREAKFEKIVKQHLGDAIVENLHSDWHQTQLPPKYFEGSFQIHESFTFLNQKTGET